MKHSFFNIWYVNIRIKRPVVFLWWEIISIGGFVKEILDPVNLVTAADATGTDRFFRTGDKAQVLGLEIEAKSVVLTNGTFLNGLIHIGEKNFGGGRAGESASVGLTAVLERNGFISGRMKTGTPPRLDGRTIDYSKTEEQKGDEKVVGFLCAAGGKGSYMSVMSLANSLMLDFRCLILPRFVYSVGEDFEEDEVTDPKVKERVMELAKELDRICVALNK